MEYETAEIAGRLLVWTMLLLLVAEWRGAMDRRR